MKKALQNYLHFLLSNLKSYRRKKGGKWFHIQEFEVSGFAGPGEYWVQKLPAGNQYDIIGEESYYR